MIERCSSYNASLLDELDEDLLVELDEVVRANQLNCLPFVKSCHAERALLEKHPWLTEAISRSRQAKIDAVDLQAKLVDVNIPLGSSFEDRDSERLHVTPQQQQRHKRPSGGSSIINTPPLTPASCAQALPSSPDDHAKLPSPMVDASQNIAPGSLDSGDASFPGSSGFSLGSTPSATGMASRSTDRPWGPAPTLTSKADMQEIMKQASSSRSSNVFMGLRSQAKSADRHPGAHATRLSQKQRKRQQASDVHRPIDDEHSQSPAQTSVTLTSPWKTVAPASKSSVTQKVAEADLPTRNAGPSQTRSITTPQLTMRQTVANAPAPTQVDHSLASPVVTPQPKHRSVSTPQISKTGSSSGASNTRPITDPRMIPIQSIRHHPRPQDSSPSFHMQQTMSDIISQEQAGKDAIKEAAAKRSLQEIQQEQEFQVGFQSL